MTAYIPDNPDLYDYLTGIQYLNFVADIYGVEKGVRREAHRTLLRHVPHRRRPSPPSSARIRTA